MTVGNGLGANQIPRNFTDVFKTPGKMRGKTPRTARKRNVEEDRVVRDALRCLPIRFAKLTWTHNKQPLSEIFSSAHKQVENKASPSPFIHRVISKSSAATTATATAAPASPRPKEAEKVLQPQYPDLSQNLNSFQKYNTDSGYHGMEEDDDMVLPSTQPDTQSSTQPMDVEEPTALNSQADVSMSLQAADDSFHSAQENVRARGETIEPMNIDSTPAHKQATTPTKASPKEAEPEKNSTPTPKVKSKSNSIGDKQKQAEKPTTSQEPAPLESSPQKPAAASSPPKEKETQDDEMENEDPKDDTVLDNFDDIGSPSDNSTPERLPVRKSSLSFASLPAREPLTKSIGGSRLSRTSHIDLPKLNSGGRLSYLGRQTGGHRMTQITAEENVGASGSMDIDDDKDTGANADAEQTSKLQATTPAQSLHERISMLGKPQPSRAKKSIAAPTIGLGSASQVAYPDLSTTKSGTRNESSSSKNRDTPPSSEAPAGEDDWIPQRPNLQKSKTADVMENLNVATNRSAAKKGSAQEHHSAEPERPKSSYSIFSSPRPHGHQQSASVSNIPTEASTTPTGSPRRYEGPLSASKMRLQSIMKSAKGLFTSTGSARFELSSPEQARTQPKEQVNAQRDDDEEEDSHHEQSRQVASPPRQEGRRTRSSTERAEKQRQRELEEHQREEARQEEARQEEARREEARQEEARQEEARQEAARQEKAREQERQRAIQLKAAQNKSSVEPEDRSSYKSSQSLRQQSREPESNQEGSRIAMPQSKQNDRRPRPTREALQKPKPQPVSVRVGSTLPRGMTMSSANSQDMSGPAPAPTPASKQSTLKKKPSNNSLHTTSSTSSFKSSISTQSQAQRKAQLASERKREQEERRREQEERKREQEERKREQEERKREQEERKREQEEREAKKKEDQRREQERKRALQLQQQEEARWQAESRAEQERERREQSAQEDSKRAANKQAIENWRLENAARKQEPGSTRPASRLGSLQPYGRSINPPPANTAKPPKRMMDEDAGHRPAVSKPSNVLPSGESKRRKTEDEHNPMQPVRPAMARPIRQPSSSIRKVSTDLEFTQLLSNLLTLHYLTAFHFRPIEYPAWFFHTEEPTSKTSSQPPDRHVQVGAWQDSLRGA